MQRKFANAENEISNLTRLREASNVEQVCVCCERGGGGILEDVDIHAKNERPKKNLKIADVQKRSADVEMKLKEKAETLEKELGQKGDDLLRLRGYMHTCVCA